ncbi:MAG: hypothetical protein RDV48_05835 [Candidatus Eremiobacteraeota bacterium]|nr:hypothetical protein [Candidatus Eremiobacteraeota bacterium]
MREEFNEIYEIGESILIFLGTMGFNGLLTYGREGEWKYHDPESLAWDCYHQEVFRNFKADRITLHDLEERGIALPNPEKIPAPSPGKTWADNFNAKTRLDKVPPAVREHLKSRSPGPVKVYLVLVEDFYETSFGDGRFLYPEAAYYTREAAGEKISRLQREEPDKAKREWYRYTLKEVILRVEGAEIVADLNIDSFEHYSIEDIVRLLSRLRPK